MSARAEIAVGMSSCGIAAGARVVFEALSKDVAGEGPRLEGRVHGLHRRLPRGAHDRGAPGRRQGIPLRERGRGEGDAHRRQPPRGRDARRRAAHPRRRPVPREAEADRARQLRRDRSRVHRPVHRARRLRRAEEGHLLHDPRAGHRGDEDLGPARPGRRGVLHGQKWSFARQAVSATGKKYVICNADEGDPGAFMDRSVLEGDPHAVLEGMLICAYAIGADEGYIYVRAEYPLAIKRLQIAVDRRWRSAACWETSVLGSASRSTCTSRKARAPSSAARRPP